MQTLTLVIDIGTCTRSVVRHLEILEITGQHTDCTLWFLLDLHPDAQLIADPVEFSGYGWFRRSDIADWPAGRTDPQMGRALAKLDAYRHAAALPQP